MASLYVSYYSAVSNGCASNPIGSEVVTTSGESAQSGVCKGIAAMLFSSAAHYVTAGADPTATAGNGVLVPAGVPLWLTDIPFGHKLAAVTV